jgi:hypothetical protein
MRLPYHAATSVVISGILILVFKSWVLAGTSFVAGIFIDIDHIPDFIREHGTPFRLRRFFEVCHKCQFDRIILIGHGWEWLTLVALSAWISGWNPWITGALIGLSHHMMLDAIGSASHLKTYSLIWRWKNNFEFDIMFPRLTAVKYRNME